MTPKKSENDAHEYFQTCRNAFGKIFSDAKRKNELEFALSLCPESRPYAISTFIPAQVAISEYLEFLVNNPNSQIKMRVALACYSHIAESSGLWEIIANMISVKNGLRFDIYPFSEIVVEFGNKDEAIDPNANRVLRTLSNYSKSYNELELYSIFNKAFDSDVRNGFAHADYVLMNDGICLGPRYKRERIVTWPEFENIFNKALAIYNALNSVRDEYLRSYETPRIFNVPEPEKFGYTTVRIELQNSALSISQIFYPNPT